MTYLGLNLNILAIDFDGTITKEGRFPEIGEPRIEVINYPQYTIRLRYRSLGICRGGAQGSPAAQ